MTPSFGRHESCSVEVSRRRVGRDVSTGESMGTMMRIDARAGLSRIGRLGRPWALVVVLAVGACSLGTELAYAPYPPDFEIVPRERLESSMWVLAAEIRDLDRLIRAPLDGDDPALRERVRLSLDRMTIAARRLRTSGRSTPHHPVLGQHLDAFLLRLERASRAIERTPPDYFQASALAGGCFLCHGAERATARLSSR